MISPPRGGRLIFFGMIGGRLKRKPEGFQGILRHAHQFFGTWDQRQAPRESRVTYQWMTDSL